MRVIGAIPARYGSTRFPGKALADLAGRPLIWHVYQRASLARSLDEVWVATDDERILQAVEGFGGRARMTSRSHRSGTDRLAELVRDLPCDLVVNVQGDEPLIEPEAIDRAVEPLAKDPALPLGTLACPLDPEAAGDPNVVKVVVDREGFALYFSRAAIPYLRAGGRGPEGPGQATPVLQHLGLYVYRRETLLQVAAWEPTPLELAEGLEQLRALERGIRIRVVVTDHPSVGVDTPADLERVRRILRE